MSTPHNAANQGDFAKTVLMPGDPLRAKFIAENFLENCKEVTNVRGMLGYTGTYKGKPVSVMGSGMGMPSIGIYSYELFTQYDVERIIRIGSAGSYSEQAKVFDVVLASAAYSESSYAKTQNGYDKDTILPSEALNDVLRASAKMQQIPLQEGVIHSSDVFYCEEDKTLAVPYWQALRETKGCLAVEMESFALFHNANVTGKEAACLLTISDSFVAHTATTALERQTSFTNMIQIALGSLLV
ncbi:MAG: purine-nucleoside phosphorylase [Ruthenibacterium sp.]